MSLVGVLGCAAKSVEVSASFSRAYVRGFVPACGDVVVSVGQSLAGLWPVHTSSEGASTTAYQAVETSDCGNGIGPSGSQPGYGYVHLDGKGVGDLQQAQRLRPHFDTVSPLSCWFDVGQGSAFSGWRPRSVHSSAILLNNERGDDDQVGTEHSADRPESTGDMDHETEDAPVSASSDLEKQSENATISHKGDGETENLAFGDTADANGASDRQSRNAPFTATSKRSEQQLEGLRNPTREQTCMVTIVAKAFEPEMVENFQDSMLAVWVEDEEAAEALPEGTDGEVPALSDGSDGSQQAPPAAEPRAPRTTKPRAKSVALPTHKRRFTVLRSPHIDKKSREQFEINVHKRIVKVPVTMKELPLLVSWLKDNSFLGVQLGVTVNYQTPLRVPGQQ